MTRIVDRYTVADLRRLAMVARYAGIGEDGQALYALCFGLAIEKEEEGEYHAKVQQLKAAKDKSLRLVQGKAAGERINKVLR